MTRSDEILAQADPFYFLDYAVFTGALRNHAAKSFEAAFAADPNPVHRRFHILNLLKEEYAAYEDAGAMLDAFLRYRNESIKAPLARLIKFTPSDVRLTTVFKRHRIGSGDDLHAALRLDEWVPAQWNEWFPRLNLRKALLIACGFLFECGVTQNQYGVIAYNKIKHGLLIVPSAKAYVGSLPDAPAALFPNTRERIESGASPIGMAPFDMGDETVQTRYSLIEFVQCNLRLFAGLYVVWRYPDLLKERGVDPQELFACSEFYDVRHLIEEVTLKK